MAPVFLRRVFRTAVPRLDQIRNVQFINDLAGLPVDLHDPVLHGRKVFRAGADKKIPVFHLYEVMMLPARDQIDRVKFSAKVKFHQPRGIVIPADDIRCGRHHPAVRKALHGKTGNILLIHIPADIACIVIGDHTAVPFHDRLYQDKGQFIARKDAFRKNTLIINRHFRFRNGSAQGFRRNLYRRTRPVVQCQHYLCRISGIKPVNRQDMRGIRLEGGRDIIFFTFAADHNLHTGFLLRREDHHRCQRGISIWVYDNKWILKRIAVLRLRIEGGVNRALFPESILIIYLRPGFPGFCFCFPGLTFCRSCFRVRRGRLAFRRSRLTFRRGRLAL